MTSNLLSVVDLQPELRLVRRPNTVDIPVELIRSKKTSGGAFSLACDTSGLEDKEIAGAFKKPIDGGTFSRMRKGTNTLDADLLAEFCQIVGNKIYPEWLAYQVRCTLVEIQSEAERRAEAAELALRAEREKTKLLTDLLQGRASA